MKASALPEKLGSFGAIVSAMGCASCFPVLGALGATLGLGFLARYEGVFINTLLPVFAGIALFFNLISWVSHRQHFRGAISCTGPLMVLATLYLFWTDSWSTYMFYLALAMMFSVSIWDLVSPAGQSCATKVATENL